MYGMVKIRFLPLKVSKCSCGDETSESSVSVRRVMSRGLLCLSVTGSAEGADASTIVGWGHL